VGHIDEYRVMVTRSRWFLDLAKEAYRRQQYDLAVFLAEQAVQLRIKAALLRIAGYYPGVHGVRLLLGELSRTVGGEAGERIKRFIAEKRSLLSELEDAYLIARYAPKQYTREDAEDLIAVAEETIGLVEEVEGSENSEPPSREGKDAT
jgi:HEPN domain-containing protein